MRNSTIYLITSIITFVIGYIFLKYAFHKFDSAPFVQEVVLIILGTIATIAITAALLNKQSEVEMEKEQRVKIFDLKSDLYFELIDFIGDLIKRREIEEKDLITLEFLTHKISTIANKEVLLEYSNLIQNVKNTSKDGKISTLESDLLSAGLARLCGVIRYDLVQRDSQSKDEILQIIKENIQKI